jgi:hypothetical protein
VTLIVNWDKALPANWSEGYVPTELAQVRTLVSYLIIFLVTSLSVVQDFIFLLISNWIFL